MIGSSKCQRPSRKPSQVSYRQEIITIKNQYKFVLSYVIILLVCTNALLGQQSDYFSQLKSFAIVSEFDVELNNTDVSGGIYVGRDLLLKGSSSITNGKFFMEQDGHTTSLIINNSIQFLSDASTLNFQDSSLLKISSLDQFSKEMYPSGVMYTSNSKNTNTIELLNKVDTLIHDVGQLVDLKELFNYYRSYSTNLFFCFPNGNSVIGNNHLTLNAGVTDKTVFTLSADQLNASDTLKISGATSDHFVINLDLRNSPFYVVNNHIIVDGVKPENIIWNVLSQAGIRWDTKGLSKSSVLNVFSNTEVSGSNLVDLQLFTKSAVVNNLNFSNNLALTDIKACVNCPINFASLGGHKQLCQGSTIELCPKITAGVGPYTYKWGDGTTGKCKTLKIQDHGMIQLEVTDALGCMANDEIFIEMLSAPTANAGDDILICGVQGITLTASGGVGYSWSTGDNGHSISVVPTVSTDYHVTVTDDKGCSDEDIVSVEVEEQGTLSGVIFDDENYNVLKDVDEKGLDAIVIKLLTPDNYLVEEQITDDQGSYLFTTCPGEYKVELTLPDEYMMNDFDASRQSLIKVDEGDVVVYDIALNSGSVVPLEWLNMSLLYEDHSNKVKLIWATAQEVNVDRFEVYHSEDGISWEVINELKAKNNTHNRYEVYHDSPRGTTHYYRVKQIDYNESFSWSSTKKIEIRNEKEVEISFYPNPTKDILNVEYSRQVDMEVEIYTRLGQKIEATLKDKQIDIRHLPKGNYIISFRNSESKSLTVDAFVKL